jgi:hypothetical protein
VSESPAGGPLIRGKSGTVGAGRHKTHAEIAVRDRDCIRGLFCKRPVMAAFQDGVVIR